MSTQPAAAPAVEPVAGIGDGIAGTLYAFGNIPGAVQRIVKQWFWIYPTIVFAGVVVINQILTVDQRLHVTQVTLEQRGMSADQIQQQLAITAKFMPVAYIVTPLFVVGLIALGALIMRAMGSAMGLKVGRFGIFMGVAAAGSMPAVLQLLLGSFLVRAKSIDDIQTAADLLPPFGLNIVIDHAPKLLEGLLGFFSIFQIWSIVVSALLFAGVCRTSAGKGFIATAPGWILGALFAMVGALFS